MDRKQALTFAAQSVLGAAKMVLETGVDPEQLRINVCSPGGTTIEAVKTLQQGGFSEIIAAGFDAAAEKSKIMTKE
jgi:pyrroline-5-carboxylate reductase